MDITGFGSFLKDMPQGKVKAKAKQVKMSPERAAAEQRDRDERQARIIASFK